MTYGMRVYRVDDGYVIADDAGPMPGIYATRDAAERACRIAETNIPALAVLAREGCPITLDDLELLVGTHGR